MDFDKQSKKCIFIGVESAYNAGIIISSFRYGQETKAGMVSLGLQAGK